ncbi:MAG: tryptophan-rich sensory protein [Acidobacteria bacterium]|nr:tryptophan-rich sensory protein [Acidobacteriota bacterium]
MTSTTPPPETTVGRARSAGALIAFLAIAFGVAAIGGFSTVDNVNGWYAGASKAFWNPPNTVFGPVWTVLYSLMSVSAWLIWRERIHPELRSQVRAALTAYIVQLVLNAIWTPAFFGLYPALGISALWIALAIIVAIDVGVLVTMLRFWRVRKGAAVLLIPYWAWVLYATTLNVAIVTQNR